MTTPATANPTTPPNPNAPTSTPGAQESPSKPLGSGTPAPTTPPAPAAAAPAPTEKPPAEPAKRGKMQFVTSAEQVEAMLGDGGETSALMPRSAIKKIKEKFEEKGRTAGQAELKKQLEAQGFGSIEEALLAASEAKRLREEAEKAKGTPPAPGKKTASFLPPRGTTPPGTTPPPANDQAERRRTSELTRERQAREAAEAQLATERAENALRMECLQADVLPDETDYVLDKLRGHVGGLSDEQLATFDSSKWLEEMKKNKPYLFKATLVPSTTGVSSPNNVPAAPTTTETANKAGDENVVDARKMTPKQWREHLEKKGYRKTS